MPPLCLVQVSYSERKLMNCALEKGVLLQTHPKNTEKKKMQKHHLVSERQRGLFCWSLFKTIRLSLAIVFFTLSPNPYQKMLLCKMSKKKEAREVISVSVLIASGIIGTLLGSLHELPASQKTAPTAPLHSCQSFEKYCFL